jgi:hypothetical protein
MQSVTIAFETRTRLSLESNVILAPSASTTTQNGVLSSHAPHSLNRPKADRIMPLACERSRVKLRLEPDDERAADIEDGPLDH